jgi:adenosine deaminase
VASFSLGTGGDSVAEVGAAADWDADWVKALPKAEVHCHMEGCIERDLVRRAARRHHVAVPFDEGEDATGAPPISSLADLLSYLDFSCALIDQADELASIAYAAARHATASGACYIDVIITPLHWQAWRGRVAAMVDAIDGGFREAEQDGLAPAGLCLSINRGESAGRAREMVEWMVQARHPRVVALSIDGNEQAGSHNDRFAPAFALARSHGLHRCAHAGESSGPGGVREAVELLGAERIDHGIRAIEDPVLVRDLAARRVALDICPTSNRILGLTPDPSRHPLERLRAAGVGVSLNTDDPLIYGCELLGEYVETAETFSWDKGVLGSIARTSIESCFAEEGHREELVRALERYLGASSGEGPAAAGEGPVAAGEGPVAAGEGPAAAGGTLGS